MLGVCLLFWLVLPVGGLYAGLTPMAYYDYGFVFELARNLIARHRFETIIQFSTNQETEVPAAQQLVMDSLERLLLQQLKLPMVIMDLAANASLSHIINHKTLVLVGLGEPEYSKLFKVLLKILDNRHNVYLLFVVTGVGRVTPNREELREFFARCWSHNFANVALTFQQVLANKSVLNELYSYTPFPQVTVLNVTSFGVDYEWPYFQPTDVKGYEFQLPYFRDPPFTYLFSDGHLRGITGSQMSEYVFQTKGRAKMELHKHVNRDNYFYDFMMLAAQGKIDFGVNPFSTVSINANLTDGVFNFDISRSCLMVPWIRSSALKMFLGDFKYFYFIPIILVVVMPLIWQLTARQGLKGLYLGFVIFAQQSLDTRCFCRLPRVYKYFHISMLMVTMLLGSLRIASLSAHLSVQQMDSQINTMEDFLASDLRIMVTESHKKIYIDSGIFPAAVQQRLTLVNFSTWHQHLDTLNTSYSYITSKSYKDVLAARQRFLLRPLHRIVEGFELCSTPYFVGVPIQFNSPFKESLTDFSLNAFSSGMEFKWWRRTKHFLLVSGVYRILRDEELPFAIIKLNDLELLLQIYGVAVLSCVLCLLLEILWMRLTAKRGR